MPRQSTQSQLDLVAGLASGTRNLRQIELGVQAEVRGLLKQLLLECADAARTGRTDDGQDHAGSS